MAITRTAFDNEVNVYYNEDGYSAEYQSWSHLESGEYFETEEQAIASLWRWVSDSLDEVEAEQQRAAAMVQLNEVVTVVEAAAITGTPEITIRKACERGSINSRKSGATWLMLRSDAVARWGITYTDDGASRLLWQGAGWYASRDNNNPAFRAEFERVADADANREDVEAEAKRLTLGSPRLWLQVPDGFRPVSQLDSNKAAELEKLMDDMG